MNKLKKLYKDYFGYKLNESDHDTFNSNNIIFSINDEKLDDMLRANHNRELDYKKDLTGDVYYMLSKKEFDRFIDYADSRGYDVDYENSEDSVIYVKDSNTDLHEETTGSVSTKDPKQAEELAKKGINVTLSEDELGEAKLVNGIDEYRGGVEYAIKDVNIAKQVSADIKQWAEKKGFTIIKRTVSRNGKNGYFYFRLSNDPAKDAQRIQGYFAQRIELSAFRFRVRNESSTEVTTSPPAPTRKF